MREHCQQKYTSSPVRTHSGDDRASAFLSQPSSSSVDPHTVMRKSTCACGGGCPSCSSHSESLRISQPNDAAEIEADRLADQVMRMPVSDATASDATSAPIHNHVQPDDVHRKCSSCEEDELDEPVMRKEANVAADAQLPEPPPASDGKPPSIRSVIAAGGAPLDRETRGFFEPRFGIDLGHVRVHTGHDAVGSARSVRARAYTVGHDVVFGSGEWSPATTEGKRLLAHELAHVLQPGAAETVRRKDAPEFGDELKDPECPTGHIQLGKVEPDPPCDPDRSPEDDLDLDFFEFCRGSDVFRDRTAPGQIRTFVRNQPALARFILHAYASREGDAKENENLSCHRARRVSRELENAGALPENIQIKGKGVTTKFNVVPFDDFRDDNLRANRRIVLKVETTDIPPTPELPPPEPVPDDITPQQRLERTIRRQQQIVKTALERLRGGHYRLAADAYMSRWTCGEFTTLRGAVDRIEAQIEGTPEAGGLSAGTAGFETEKEPFDIILLNQRTFNATDALTCVMARIVDLTFHLKTQPHITQPFNGREPRVLRHDGGLFLDELAGIRPCVDPSPTGTGPGTLWFNRPTEDPLKDLPLPPCAEKPLEGAMVSPEEAKKKGHDLGGKKPLRFKPVSLLSVTNSVEPTDFRFDLSTNKAVLGKPGDAGHPRVLARSTVGAEGDPSIFPRYQLGYIRTVQTDDTVVEYVDGFRLLRQLPTPVRDGKPETVAPWLDSSALLEPGPPDSPAELEDSSPANPPELEFPFAMLTNPFLAQTTTSTGEHPAEQQAGRLPIDPLAENIVSRVRRTVNYTLWTAARRVDAPLDRHNTTFIEGQHVEVKQDKEVRLAASARVSASGDARVNAQDAGPGLEHFARLGGPVPAAFAGGGRSFAFGDKRVVSRGLPTDRDDPKVDGLTSQEYRDRVKEMTKPLREALGLTQGLEMVIFLDRRSGRINVPGISQVGSPGQEPLPKGAGTGIGEVPAIMSLPVHVRVALVRGEAGPFAPRSTLDTLAENFYIRARNELVLRRSTLPDEVKRGGSTSIDVFLGPLPGAPRVLPRMHQVPGALSFFRKLWTAFTADCRFERSSTIIMDRRTNSLREVFRTGGPATVDAEGKPSHSVPVCVVPSEGGENHLNVHEIVLGAVHVHPRKIPPSGDDHNLVRKIQGMGPMQGGSTELTGDDVHSLQRRCGTDLYVMLRDQSGDVFVIRLGTEFGRNDDLGPILGDMPGCK